jgi:signal transduction histidine kinase
MLLRHPIALRANVGLLALALSLTTLGGALLLSFQRFSTPGGDAGELLAMGVLAGLALGGVLGWTLRPGGHAEEPGESLSRENTRLRAQNQQALELVGEAAHELGNPLMALQLRLHRLRAQTDPGAPVAAGLTQAEREARRMGLLLHDLLDLSRLSAGPLALALEEVELTALLHEVAARFSEQAAAAGSALVVKADGPVHGRWDRQRLERITTNLLSNALKFGQGHPVEVHLRTEGPFVRLEVRDQGLGISPEAQERLFGRFERAGDTHHPGTGLGLYIVRQLVETHGGSVHVSSRPGHGATFSVTLPLLPH